MSTLDWRSLRQVAWGVHVIGLAACGPAITTEVDKNIEQISAERNPDKLVARARGFANLGDLVRAEQYLVSALDNGGNVREVMPLLIQICVASGRYRVALKYATDQLKQERNNIALRFLVGSLHMALEEPVQAREHLEQVLRAQPNHVDAHYALAIIARDYNNDLVKSDYHFRQYLRLRPTGPHADEAREGLLMSVP